MFTKYASTILIISISSFYFYPLPRVYAQSSKGQEAVEEIFSGSSEKEKIDEVEIKKPVERSPSPNPSTSLEKVVSWGAVIGGLALLSVAAYFLIVPAALAASAIGITVAASVAVGAGALVIIGIACNQFTVCKPIIDNILGTKEETEESTFKEGGAIRGSVSVETEKGLEKIKEQEKLEGREVGLPKLPEPIKKVEPQPLSKPKSIIVCAPPFHQDCAQFKDLTRFPKNEVVKSCEEANKEFKEIYDACQKIKKQTQ